MKLASVVHLSNHCPDIVISNLVKFKATPAPGRFYTFQLTELVKMPS